MFANAVSQAKNFNEVLINTRSLMGRLGVDTNQVKDGLEQAFLDGQISLEEYQADMQQLNVISQNTLTGPNGLAEGFTVLANNIKGSPRTALQALGLEFNTLAQQGIKSTTDIVAFMTSHFGPQAGELFQQLAAIGIRSFDDIKNASAEQLGQVFAILQQLSDFFASTFGSSTSDAAGDVERSATRMSRALKQVQSDADGAARAIKGVGAANQSDLRYTRLATYR